MANNKPTGCEHSTYWQLQLEVRESLLQVSFSWAEGEEGGVTGGNRGETGSLSTPSVGEVSESKEVARGNQIFHCVGLQRKENSRWGGCPSSALRVRVLRYLQAPGEWKLNRLGTRTVSSKHPPPIFMTLRFGGVLCVSAHP